MRQNIRTKAVVAAAFIFFFSSQVLAAETESFSSKTRTTSHFRLYSLLKNNNPGRDLTVFIEGDGRAWISKKRLSNDPTPKSSLVRDLAAQCNRENVAYLARPFQFITSQDPTEDSVYWSTKRFSQEVVTSMNQALDSLKQETQSKRIHLVGYSGGGALAVLMAARRSDIASITTIAGNLDTKEWVEHHHITPLIGSLNPVEEAGSIKGLRQTLLVGGKDKIMPRFVAENFARAQGNPAHVKIVEIPDATHDQWDLRTILEKMEAEG